MANVPQVPPVARGQCVGRVRCGVFQDECRAQHDKRHNSMHTQTHAHVYIHTDAHTQTDTRGQSLCRILLLVTNTTIDHQDRWSGSCHNRSVLNRVCISRCFQTRSEAEASFKIATVRKVGLVVLDESIVCTLSVTALLPRILSCLPRFSYRITSLSLAHVHLH